MKKKTAAIGIKSKIAQAVGRAVRAAPSASTHDSMTFLEPPFPKVQASDMTLENGATQPLMDVTTAKTGVRTHAGAKPTAKKPLLKRPVVAGKNADGEEKTHTSDDSMNVLKNTSGKAKDGSEVPKLKKIVDPEGLDGGSTHVTLPDVGSLVSANFEEEVNADGFDDGDFLNDIPVAEDEELGIEPINTMDALPQDDLIDPLGGQDPLDNIGFDDGTEVIGGDEEEGDGEKENPFAKKEEANAEMDVLDADGVDDSEIGHLAFANIGSSVSVLRTKGRNRIIATLTRAGALAMQNGDTYQTPEFQDVTMRQIEQLGLREGLHSMGFKLDRITTAAANPVAERRVATAIQAKVKQIANEQAKQKAVFQQSLAIASVGMQKGYFEGTTNPLYQAVIAALVEAGVQRPQRIVAHAFAQASADHAKELFALAQRISEADDVSRASYCKGMNMISDHVVNASFEADQEDVTPQDAGIEDMGDNLFDDETPIEADTTHQSPASVTAAFNRVGTPVRAGLQSQPANAGVAAILRGDAPLRFGY